jgi:hypothetical protein
MVSLTLIAQPLVTEARASAAAPSVVRLLAAGLPGPAAGAALEERLDVAVDALREHGHGA